MSDLPQIIELKRIADLPAGRDLFSTTECKTAEGAQEWASQLGVEAVYIFRPHTGNLIAWALMPEREKA